MPDVDSNKSVRSRNNASLLGTKLNTAYSITNNQKGDINKFSDPYIDSEGGFASKSMYNRKNSLNNSMN